MVRLASQLVVEQRCDSCDCEESHLLRIFSCKVYLFLRRALVPELYFLGPMQALIRKIDDRAWDVWWRNLSHNPNYYVIISVFSIVTFIFAELERAALLYPYDWGVGMVGPDFRLPPVETVTSTKSNHESKIISSVDPCRIKTKPFFCQNRKRLRLRAIARSDGWWECNRARSSAVIAWDLFGAGGTER